MEASFSHDSASTRQIPVPESQPGRPGSGVYLLLVGGFAALGIFASAPALRPLFVAIALLLTAVVCRIAIRRPPAMVDVIVFAVIFRLLLLPLLPSLSDDAYRYIWDGGLVWQGLNPFLFKPGDEGLAELRHHPVFAALNSRDYYTVYPPVSQALFALWGWIPGRAWPVAYLLMKLTVVGLELTAVVLLSRITNPGMAILYAWNPLVVVETAGQLHTESLLVFFLIVGIYACRSRRRGWSVAAFTAAVWVKLYPVFFLPFLFKRVGWRWIGLLLALSALMLAPFLHPELPAHIVESLTLYVSYFEFYAGPYLALKALAYKLGLFSDVERTVGLILVMTFLLFSIGLYVRDLTTRRDLADTLFLVLGAWYVTSTTIHPWYFLGLLALLPLVQLPRAPWIWLSGCSMATYLHYSHDVYWPFVWIGWGGWLFITIGSSKTVRTEFDARIQDIMKRRGRRKAAFLRPFLSDETEEIDRPLAVLDLGAGEGYVGEALTADGHHSVTLCEIRDSNRTDLPQVLFDGRMLPFGDGWFDATIIVFTLHHCEDHVQILKEAARVTSGKVVILESVFKSEMGRRVLDFLDGLANWVRSGGEMTDHRHFRKTEDWIELVETMGFEVESVRTHGRIHHQALLVTDPPRSIH